MSDVIELHDANEQTPDKNLIFLDEVEPIETEWLWYPYIPQNKITVIMGDPGEGKSTLALNLAASVSAGRDFPDPKERRVGDIVVYQNAEDGLADTIVPRLKKARAYLPGVCCINELRKEATIDSFALYEVITQMKPKLVILDPLQAYLGKHVDMHRANEIRPLMNYLSSMAETFKCAIILIAHMNKKTDIKAMYRAIGSIDITAAARSVLLVARDPHAPEHRVIMQVKNSLAQAGEPVSFTIDEDGKFIFEGPYEGGTDAVMQTRDLKINKACRLLEQWLSEAENGMLLAREVYAMADSEDIPKRTVERAKAMLHIRAERKSDGWYWCREKQTVS